MLAVRRSRTGSMRVMDAKVAAGIRARLSIFGTGSAARESFASEAGFIASGKIAAPPQQCAATDQTPAIGTKPAGWREGTWHSEPVGARPRARRLANSLVFDERLRAVLRYCGVEALEDRAVNQKTFNVVASVIFALVALLHLLRIYMGWPIVIGSWTVPMWVSWIGLVVAGSLSYFGLSFARAARR
jgi:hypothetical protein